MHGGKGAFVNRVSRKLFYYARMLSGLSLANFPSTVESAGLNQFGLEEIRRDEYMWHVFGVCRYALSMQRLINAILCKLAEVKYIPSIRKSGTESDEIRHPYFFDQLTMEADEAIFSSIVSRRYYDLACGLRKYGVFITRKDISEMAPDLGALKVLLDNLECVNYPNIEDCFDDYEDIDSLDNAYVAYEIRMPTLESRDIKAMADFFSYDIDISFAVSVYVGNGKILLIAPSWYQTGEGNPMAPRFCGFYAEEDGQAITAAAFIYMYAMAKECLLRKERRVKNIERRRRNSRYMKRYKRERGVARRRRH